MVEWHNNEKSFRPSLSMLHERASWCRYNNGRHSYSDVIVRETIMSYVAIAAIIREYLAQTLFQGGDSPWNQPSNFIA